jgi:hypothetical protein
MTIKKTLNQETKTISDAKQIMSQNEKNIIQESRYQSNLRRNTSPLTKPREQAKNNKEPHVIVKGFDVVTGKMRAEDKSTGKIFNAKVLSDGPLAVGSRVMGFPPANGESEGYIRGPMKGPPVPPLEIPKKPKKKEEEIVEVLELRYTLIAAFCAYN